jgi:HSP20 family protein
MAQTGTQTRTQASEQTGLTRPLTYDLMGPLSPFSMMRRMAEEFDRAFSGVAFGGGQANPVRWLPSIEVVQRDGSYAVRAELAGLKPEDVKVEVVDGALVLEGERKFVQEDGRGGQYRSERAYGRFYRSIPLPEGAKIDQARAKFENGVLEVTVPISDKAANRQQIPIEAAAPANEKKS